MCALLLPLCACSGESSKRVGVLDSLFQGGASKNVAVTVALPSVEIRTITLSAPCQLVPSKSANVESPADGQVTRVSVRQGDRVRAGEIILELSEQNTALQLSQERAALRDAQADLERKNYVLMNRDRLLEEGRLSQSEYDLADDDVLAQQESIDRSRQKIEALEQQVESRQLIAPMAGILEKLDATVGQHITAKSTAAVIIQTDPLLAAFSLPSYAVDKVRAGTVARITLTNEPDKALAAPLISIGNTVSESGTVLAQAQLSNTYGTLKVGTACTATVATQEQQRVYSVPEQAVFDERMQRFVFVVENGRAHRKRVEVMDAENGTARIASGLTEKDVVIVRGREQLVEGTLVEVWK